MSGSMPSTPNSARETWLRSCGPASTASFCRRSKALPGSPRSTGCSPNSNATADAPSTAVSQARNVARIDPSRASFKSVTNVGVVGVVAGDLRDIHFGTHSPAEMTGGSSIDARIGTAAVITTNRSTAAALCSGARCA